jgi:plastocyanin
MRISLILISVCQIFAYGGDLEGTIVIKHKLTKSKVTPTANSYQRGAAVPVGVETKEGLAAEYQRVVVYLEGQLPPAEPSTVVMLQKNRQFIPDTLMVPVGSQVSFPNLDPIFHNVFSLSRLASFDLGNYPKDQTRTVTFRKPGVVFVNCHLHPNMAAAIVVTPNGWAARLDDDGRFHMGSIPPGNYTVVAWHRAAGFFRQPLRVTASGKAKVEFFIPLEESPKELSRQIAAKR